MAVVYLVERIQQMQLNGRATYWAGCSDLVPGGETNDPWDACWFARKQDAARVAVDKFGKNLARAGWQIVEHSFEMAKLSQAKAFPASDDPPSSWLPKGFEFLSGMPSRLRQRRLILTIQAFFDDSGTKGTGRWMAMSGLLGEAKLIASLADEWDKWLRARHPGSIRYFKMDEAADLTGEFQDWNPHRRDEKIRQMANVINRDDLLEIPAWIDLKAFETVSARWKPIQGPGHSTMSAPYLTLFYYVMVSAVTEAVARGAKEPMEIIFDEQNIFRKGILSEYDGIREQEREIPERYAVMPVQPWFRDDRESFVMLQASDLLAGGFRMMADKDDDHHPFVGFYQSLCPKLKVSKYRKGIGIKEMLELEAHLHDVLKRQQQG